MPDVAQIRLDQLRPHQFGLVCYIEAMDEDAERLMALGVCTGRKVELIQTGDPLILKVFSSRVGVSARLAARVFVEPLTTENGRAPPPADSGKDAHAAG